MEDDKDPYLCRLHRSIGVDSPGICAACAAYERGYAEARLHTLTDHGRLLKHEIERLSEYDKLARELKKTPISDLSLRKISDWLSAVISNT